MKRAINRIKRLFGFDDVESEIPAVKQSGVWESDAFQPEREHRRILDTTENRASADAIRHAERMLNREFPVVAEARIMFDSRMASLRQVYEGGRAEVQVRIEVLEGNLDLRNQDLKNAEQEFASFAESVPGPARTFWPFGRRDQAEEESPRRPQRRESRRLRNARRDRIEEARETELDLLTARRELDLLPIEVRNLAEKEMAFAEQVVATYVSSVFSSMPAGSLQEGEALAEQPPLAISIPGWVPERDELEQDL